MSNGEQLRQLSRNGDEAGVKSMLITLQSTHKKKNELSEVMEGKDELSGNTALHYSCANGHEDIVKALIDAGAHVDAVNNSGNTPLHYSSLTGHMTVVRCLIDAGADLVHRNNFEHTALDQALQAGNRDVADILMAAVEKRAAHNEPESVGELAKDVKENETLADGGPP